MASTQKNNYIKNTLKNSLKFAVALSSFCGLFVSLIPFAKWYIKIYIIIGLFLLSFFLYFLCYMCTTQVIIAKRNNVVIRTMYGDVLKIKKKKNNKPVVVIPVNSAFDYKLEDELNINNPIVSSKTIHGQWIRYMKNEKNISEEQLGNLINKEIINLSVVKELKNKRGNTVQYKTGSSVFIENDDCTYMLFALTDFDENNRVIEEKKSKYNKLIEILIETIDKCQGRDVYVPIMGTGLSLLFKPNKERPVPIIGT